MYDPSKTEKKIIRFWDNQKIFDKSVKKKKNQPFFNFYDGPPFASGLPHYGHILATAIKDTVLRYWSMRGFKILWRVGWDCHGLPVENKIEKELGLKTKKEIEDYGIKKFNQACRKAVFRCTDDFSRTFKRTGRWSDYSNSYATLDNDYMESVWWVFKSLSDKDLVYKDYRVSPYCPRCGTPLSNFELNQPGAYQEVKDESVFLKFPLKQEKNTYLLVWTTTPWTLPSNTAVAVSSKIDYVKVKQGDIYLILAKDRLEVLKEENCQIKEEFKGKDLIDKEYDPLYKMDLDKEGYRVVSADFVSTDEGTGLVHIAPAFGEDDMQLARKKNLPTVVGVDLEGRIEKDLNLPGEGKFVKDADKDIKEDLKKRDLLYKEETITHSYPFCWRCDTPLLYYPVSSWYIKVTRIKDKLIKNNKKIRWVPDHLKHGRFGKWLEGARDWSVSRNRFWGAPIPAWECQDCGKYDVIGSLKELGKKNRGNNYFTLRHGETKNNIDNKIYTDAENKETSLTKKGERQIREQVSELKKSKIDLIFASPYKRTKDTANLIAKELGIKVVTDKRLRELEVGEFKGQPEKVYEDYFENDDLRRFTDKPKDGENLSQVKKRVMDFLISKDRKYKNKNILIVSHGDPLWVLRGAGSGLSDKKTVSQKKSLFLQPGELKKLNFLNLPYDEKGEVNLHRPYIDEVNYVCSCGGVKQRVSQVFDCWFESGSMPYAQWHYPFENKKLVEETFPADFIAEGMDQTRGWFYTLHVLASALTSGDDLGLGKDNPAFLNVIVNGLVLGEDGRKLSKKLQNYTPPEEIFEKYGADTLRYYLLTSSAVGEDYVASDKKIAETFRRFVSTIWNVFIFLDTYTDYQIKAPGKIKPNDVLDKWMVSRINSANEEVVNWMNQYDLTKAARTFDYLVDDFSNWYVRRSRKRLQRPETKKQKEEAEKIYAFALLKLVKMLAPFTPFISEEIYQHIGSKEESVHLESYPYPDKKVIDKNLEEKMERLRDLANNALAQRSQAGIKVRQPLQKLTINSKQILESLELSEILKEEVNVKELDYGSEIKLDTEINFELQKEGMLRELIRSIQEMRKDGGLKPGQLAYVRFYGDDFLQDLISSNKREIMNDVSLDRIELAPKRKEVFLVEKELGLEGKKIWLGLKK